MAKYFHVKKPKLDRFRYLFKTHVIHELNNSENYIIRFLKCTFFSNFNLPIKYIFVPKGGYHLHLTNNENVFGTQ